MTSTTTPSHHIQIPPVAHAISGSLASTLSMLLFYPLERVRIEMQAQASTIRRDGDHEQATSPISLGMEMGLDGDGNVDGEDEMQMKMQIDAGRKCPSSLSESPPSSHSPSPLSLSPASSPIPSSSSSKNSHSTFSSYEVIQKKEKSKPVKNDNTPLPPSLPPAILRKTTSESSSAQMKIRLQPQMKMPPKTSISSSTRRSCSRSRSRSRSNVNLNMNRLIKSSKLLQTMYTLHIQKKLYRGSTPVAFTLALSNFIFFYTLQYLKKVSHQQSASFFTSTVAGVINVLLTNPFWVANLRIVKNDDDSGDGDGDGDGDDERSESTSTSSTTSSPTKKKRKGIFQTLLQIVQEEGMGQLWNGTGASLLLVTNPAIQYYTYERIKADLIRNRMATAATAAAATAAAGAGTARRLNTSGNHNIQHGVKHGLRPVEAFLLGAFAKGLATVATYPLQLTQVLIRLQKNHKDVSSLSLEEKCKVDGDDGYEAPTLTSKRDDMGRGARRGGGGQTDSPTSNRQQYHGIMHCMMDLYQQGGVRALYAGMDAKLLQTVLTAALTFLTYEELLQVVARSYWAFTSRTRSLLGPTA